LKQLLTVRLQITINKRHRAAANIGFYASWA
jgi:hypothetical protein